MAKQERSKARTWRAIAIVFGLLAFMAVGAVLGLTPLKTVEAFLVRVDNNTGFTDVVPVMKDRTGGGDEQDTQDEFWLATYVRFRESYSFAGADVNYGMVRLLSYSGAFAEYRNFQLSSKGYTQVLGITGSCAWTSTISCSWMPMARCPAAPRSSEPPRFASPRPSSIATVCRSSAWLR